VTAHIPRREEFSECFYDKEIKTYNGDIRRESRITAYFSRQEQSMKEIPRVKDLSMNEKVVRLRTV
jgi:hypothetical protein